MANKFKSSKNLDELHDAENMHRFRVASWNLAGVNNNPFEYWASVHEPTYFGLMGEVQQYIISGEHDVPVRDIFTDSMLADILEEMRAAGMDDLEDVETLWIKDYAHHKCFSEFLLDKDLNMKRLISMPERETNRINGSDGTISCRPSVITTFTENCSNFDDWWRSWRQFIFHVKVLQRVDSKRILEFISH